jgi:hypothetical protein
MLPIIYFIGLDAHSSTSTFAFLDQEGHCVLRKTVDTSEKTSGMLSIVSKVRES